MYASRWNAGYAVTSSLTTHSQISLRALFVFQSAFRVNFKRFHTMTNFGFHLPTEVQFGPGKFATVGEVVAQFGKRCLLVTGPKTGSVRHFLPRLTLYLEEAGIEVAHFDGVIPNPTTDTIAAGAKLASSCSTRWLSRTISAAASRSVEAWISFLLRLFGIDLGSP